jgi:hypothetical protein
MARLPLLWWLRNAVSGFWFVVSGSGPGDHACSNINHKPENHSHRRYLPLSDSTYAEARLKGTGGEGRVVSGFWFLVSGLWFVVCGLWFLVSGIARS